MYEWQQGSFTISTDKHRIDVAAVHDFLSHSYWAAGIDVPTVQRGIDHALCFGLYDGPRQIGFARVITDYARFAYLADVFVLDAYQGQGLGTWLIETIMAYPDLQDVWRWLLATGDAHALYAKFGFAPLTEPERWMSRMSPARAAFVAAQHQAQGHQHEPDDRSS